MINAFQIKCACLKQVKYRQTSISNIFASNRIGSAISGSLPAPRLSTISIAEMPAKAKESKVFVFRPETRVSC